MKVIRNILISAVILYAVFAGLYVLITSVTDFPKDPHKTLAEVTRDTLRVGVTEHRPWVVIENEEVKGIEPEIVKQYAESIDAEVTFVQSSESELVEMLKHGDIDILLAGLTKKSPWKKEVGLTNPYYNSRVMAIQKGENAFLMDLSTFISSQKELITSIVLEGGK